MTAKKSLYRIKNWKKYNESLVQRGSLTIWLSDDVRETWLYEGPRVQGRPIVFSDDAITAALTIRCLFRLPLDKQKDFCFRCLIWQR